MKHETGLIALETIIIIALITAILYFGSDCLPPC